MKIKIVIFTLIVFLIGFIYLTINVLNGQMQPFNNTIYNQVALWINPILTNIMIIISCAGEWFIYLPIALLFLIIPKSRLKIGLPVTLTLLVTAFLNIVLKHVFAIARPDIHRLISETGYGYPSGHAMNGTVFIGLCAYMFIKYSHKRALKIILTTLSLVLMLTLGFSRIYLGVHNPTDILAGYLAGIVILTLAILILHYKQIFIKYFYISKKS